MTSPFPTRSELRNAQLNSNPIPPQSQAKPQKKVGFFWHLLGFVGEVLITIAIFLGLYVVWQLWWTTAQVEPLRQAQVNTFQEKNPTPATDIEPEHRTDQPPGVGEVSIGETYGVLHVPSWDWMQIPIAQGTEQWILDQAYAGHYVDTQQPGEIGNFAVAGHRRTYGNNFRAVDKLVPGDVLVVETADAYMVYTMDSFEIVDPSQSQVLFPVPNQPEIVPTERIMTMTTCHPEFGNSERYIVYSKMQYWTAKSEGKPGVLRDEPVR